MQIDLSAIELDTSIQCRATIDTGIVNEYAERMSEGDRFPPVDLYGSKSRCWIGDGWHRILAAKQNGEKGIAAQLHAGGRADALRAALASNVVHGHRRTNADKRRCVEIAIKEFPKLSSRAIAEMCGVSHTFVEGVRPEPTGNRCQSRRTSQDGRERPARREKAPEPDSEPMTPDYTGHDTALRTPTGPSNGMQLARIAVMKLEEIRDDDLERQQAFQHVRSWLNARET